MEKKRFELKTRLNPEKKTFQRDIFIDGELFDYSVDKESLVRAKSMGEYHFLAAQQDIASHFLECLSEMVGRKVTTDDVKTAKKTGFI